MNLFVWLGCVCTFIDTLKSRFLSKTNNINLTAFSAVSRPPRTVQTAHHIQAQVNIIAHTFGVFLFTKFFSRAVKQIEPLLDFITSVISLLLHQQQQKKMRKDEIVETKTAFKRWLLQCFLFFFSANRMNEKKTEQWNNQNAMRLLVVVPHYT